MKDKIKNLTRALYYRTPYTWRVPKVYYDTRELIATINNSGDIEKWQLDKLKEILRHAYTNVPGYYQLYKEAGVTPDDIQTIADIKLLPIINKETLRENIADFTSRTASKNTLFLSRTSGSTGTPFGFYKTIEEEWVEQAFVAHAWSKGGWNIHQSGFMLRGAYGGDAEHIIKKCNNSNFYVHNKSYMLSPNFLTEEHYTTYRAFLLEHKELSYIFSLPSSITLLSQLMIEHNDEGISGVTAIYLSSESIYEWQYEYIKKAFPNANVISLYGQTERVIMAYWCKDSRKYHVDGIYGITELLNNNAEVEQGETGELIGTSFWNTTTPFIRYRTKDFAVKDDSDCSYCHQRCMMLKSIEGRLQDVLVGKKGRYLPYTAFDGSLLHGSVFKDIEMYKIVQRELGKLTFELQVKETFNGAKKEEFAQIISSYLGADFVAEITIVDKIAPGKNGKYNIVEQYLPISIESRINK